MARCEACGGPIREALGGTGQADTLIDVNKFQFDDRVGRRKARRTHFCSYECAIRGLEDDLILERDDPTLWVDRRGDGPENYPDPETEPLVRRAKELLETALDGVGDDYALDLNLSEAITLTEETLDVLADRPSPDERVHLAAGDALADIYDGKRRHAAVGDAVIEYNIGDRLGLVNAEVLDALGEELEVSPNE
ncbi:hypothetical protein SAMN06269185_3316 [Natronoarchaeum philippinense]|uniref:Uncharacterized protein n=1 Tax=Natronoarchaeum philippinense TaxID=558529 RepID=A0A285PAM0_NATPI|nr:hypothetical protein [Natronoarchaeum philippinense]SNZ18273.1 hypothetical protein SAMN06269185_3316 [Natronoarchaeum philippinense]